MYLISWLLLKDTSQSSKVRALRWGPQGDSQAGHVLNPLAIIEGHQPGPAGVALGDPQGGHAPIPLDIIKDTSQGPKVHPLRCVSYGGGFKGTPRLTMYLIFWLLLKDTS